MTSMINLRTSPKPNQIFARILIIPCRANNSKVTIPETINMMTLRINDPVVMIKLSIAVTTEDNVLTKNVIILIMMVRIVVINDIVLVSIVVINVIVLVTKLIILVLIN